MTVTINGTTGIAGTNGSAGTPAVQGEDTNTGIFFPAADTVAVATGGTERMRVDSSGNAGLGVTPSAWASPFRALQVGAGAVLFGRSDGTVTQTQLGNNLYYNGTNDVFMGSGYAARYFQNNGAHRWETSTASGTAGNAITFTQAMTLDSSGSLFLGAPDFATFTTKTSGGIGVYQTGVTYTRNVFSTSGRWWQAGPDTNAAYIVYNNNNAGVYMAYGGTAWSANSDERMKTTLVPFEDAVGKVCSLRAGTGRYLTDEADVSRSFLIAQDVQAVLPEAVDVQDNEQGTLGLRYTDVMPLLVAAIKELKAEVDSLKAQLEAQ